MFRRSMFVFMIATILINVDHNMLLANKNTTRITIKLSGGCRRRGQTRTLRRRAVAVAFGSAANKEEAYARNAYVGALRDGGVLGVSFEFVVFVTLLCVCSET
jgi:hypothetical protein